MATRVRCAALAPVFTAAERGLSDWTACLYNWNRASAAPLIGWRAPGGSAGSGQWRVKARILNIMDPARSHLLRARCVFYSLPRRFRRDGAAAFSSEVCLASRASRAARNLAWFSFLRLFSASRIAIHCGISPGNFAKRLSRDFTISMPLVLNNLW
jgi:hypothetical protein